MKKVILLLHTLFLIASCNNDNVKTFPVVETLLAENVGRYSVQINSNVNSDGDVELLSRGVYYSKTPNPTIADSIQISISVTGKINDTIVGLDPNTTYYYRAFANNSLGRSYGEERNFTTKQAIPVWGDEVSDIDGNFYKTVIIGDQEWMAENLKVTKYRNGDSVATTIPPNADIKLETEPRYQWVYNNDPENLRIYGRLYTWYSAAYNRGLCPEGWHLPTIQEWRKLIRHLGGEAKAGGRLKQAGTDYWKTPNAGATNETGFSALPGGHRTTLIQEVEGNRPMDFLQKENYGFWLTATDTNYVFESNIYDSFFYQMLDYRFGSIVEFDRVYLSDGLSIRCVKD